MQADDPFATPVSMVADPSGSAGMVSPGIVETLRRTKGWVRFLGILGLIISGFMLLFGLGVGVAGLSGGGIFDQTPAPMAFSVGYAAFLALMSATYVFPCMRLLRYASGIDRLEQWRDAARLEQALDQQRAFWRLVGIFAIAMLALYALMFLALMVFGVMASFRGAR